MDLKELIRRAQEAEQEAASRKAGIDPDEALKMARVLEKVLALDLDKEEASRREALSPMDKLVEDLKANKDVGRALKHRSKVRTKDKPLHWRKKKSAKRRYDKARYQDVLKPKRRRERAELLQTAEGWWVYQNRIWKQNGVEVRMTEEEFTTVVYPSFGGRVPVLERYDARKGISLDNLLVRDSDTRKVLFDGMEYVMKENGWML